MRSSGSGVPEATAATPAGNDPPEVVAATPRRSAGEPLPRSGWAGAATSDRRGREERHGWTSAGRGAGHAPVGPYDRPGPTAPQERTAIWEETAGHLRTLYPIGAGLSGAVAMERLLTDEGDFSEPRLVAVALLLLTAFVATLIPFFHGSMRHMHSAWSEDNAPSDGLMMFDFVFLFVQTLLYFVVADLTRSPLWFGVALVILLATDVLWLSARRLFQRNPMNRRSDAPITWAWVNLPAIGALVLLLGVHSADLLSDLVLALTVTAIAVLRTVGDYIASSEFYFGPRAGL